MISIDDLDRVLGWMQQEKLQSLDVSERDARIRLRMPDGTLQATEPRAEMTIHAKGVGRFIAGHPRSVEPALQAGNHVRAGSVIGFIQNELVLLPILATHAGVVGGVHAVPGRLIDFGAPVLTLLVER